MTDPAADATRCEPLAPAEIKTAFLSACRAELAALKPGNVHVHAAGHGMDVAHFEAAAQAAAPVIARPGLSFGQRVEMAVGESLAAAGCNTNLGIILLCAPLATAALLPAPAPLHKRVGAVLSHLSQEDGDRVYAAIRAANPGGLGTTDAADVARSPDIALLDAMALAAHKRRAAKDITE